MSIKEISGQTTSFPMVKDEINHTFTFIFPIQVITREEIARCAKDLSQIVLVNRRFRAICQQYLSNLKRVSELVYKYRTYNMRYEDIYKYPVTSSLTGKKYSAGGNPQLLDAVFTGWTYPFGEHTVQHYSPDTSRDIRDIVRLTPQSLRCTLGETRLSHRVTPLFAACINDCIPLEDIEYMLQNGADSEAKIYFNGYPVQMIGLIKHAARDIITTTRAQAIEQLFLRYRSNREEGKE